MPHSCVDVAATANLCMHSCRVLDVFFRMPYLHQSLQCILGGCAVKRRRPVCCMRFDKVSRRKLLSSWKRSAEIMKGEVYRNSECPPGPQNRRVSKLTILKVYKNANHSCRTYLQHVRDPAINCFDVLPHF